MLWPWTLSEANMETSVWGVCLWVCVWCHCNWTTYLERYLFDYKLLYYSMPSYYWHLPIKMYALIKDYTTHTQNMRAPQNIKCVYYLYVAICLVKHASCHCCIAFVAVAVVICWILYRENRREKNAANRIKNKPKPFRLSFSLSPFRSFLKLSRVPFNWTIIITMFMNSIFSFPSEKTDQHPNGIRMQIGIVYWRYMKWEQTK